MAERVCGAVRALQSTSGCTTWWEKNHHAPDCIQAVGNVIWTRSTRPSGTLCNWCLKGGGVHVPGCPDHDYKLTDFVTTAHRLGNSPQQIQQALAIRKAGAEAHDRQATPAQQPRDPLKSVLTVRKKAARWRTEPDQASHDAQEGPQEAAGATQTVQDVSKAVQAPPNAPGGVYEVPQAMMDEAKAVWSTWRGTGRDRACSCSCPSCQDLEEALVKMFDSTTYWRKP